jgi:hypothetical protein
VTIDPSVQSALVTGIFGLMVACVGILAEAMRRHHRTLGEVRENTAAARHQVQNSHETNLRDDVDRVLSGLERVLEGQGRHDLMLMSHGEQIGQLASDLAMERRERMAVSDRLTSAIATHALHD